MNDFFNNLFGSQKKEPQKKASKTTPIMKNNLKLSDVPKVSFFQITDMSEQGLIYACQLAKITGLKNIFTDNKQFQSVLAKFKHLNVKSISELGLGILICDQTHNNSTIIDVVTGSSYSGTNHIIVVGQEGNVVEELAKKHKVIGFVPQGHNKDYFCGLRNVQRLFQKIKSKKEKSEVDQMGLLAKIQKGTIDLMDLEGLLGQMNGSFLNNPILKTMGLNLNQDGMKEKAMGQFSALKHILNSLTIKEKQNPKLLSDDSRITRIKKSLRNITQDQIQKLSKLTDQINKMSAGMMSMLSNPSKMSSMIKNFQSMMKK